MLSSLNDSRLSSKVMAALLCALLVLGLLALMSGRALAAPGPIEGVNPWSGQRTTTVSCRINAPGLVDGATVKLGKSGATIDATDVVVTASDNFLTCKFAIPADAALGGWDVTVTNPDTTSATLTNGFTITPAPLHWTRVNVPGFGFTTPANASAPMGLTEYKGRLYAGVTDMGASEGNKVGCTVWGYNGSTSWTQVNTTGFGTSSTWLMSNLCVLNGKMYAGASGSGNAAQVWAYDGTSWTQVNVNGFGTPAENRYINELVVFNSKLYAASNSSWNRTGIGPSRVWRYDGGTTWTQLGADNLGSGSNTSCRSLAASNGLLFAGAASGHVYYTDGSSAWADAGYPDTSSQGEAREMAAYEGKLYAGCVSSAMSTVVARYDGGTTWTNITPAYPDANNDSAKSLCVYNGSLYLGASNYNGVGAQIYRYDGSSWTQINTSGWGDFKNMGAQSLAVCNKTLYAGIGNRAPSVQFDWYGAQVWRLDTPVVDSITPGSSYPGMTVNVTDLAGANFYTDVAEPIVKLTRAGQPDITANTVNVASENKITCDFDIPADAAQGAWDVYVQGPDGQSGTKAGAFTVTTPANATWYLAEGTNAWGFSTYITVENPNNSAVSAKLTYMDPNPPAAGKGILASRTINLPPLSQTTVSSASDIGNVDFSTKVQCLQGSPIAVDRTMFWTGQNTAEPGYHSSIGANATAKTWYLPEGSSNWGFETWVLVLNPNPKQANVKLTFMTADRGPVESDQVIPANSRATFSMFGCIGYADASIKVDSDAPVVAERSVYRNDRREGSCSIGATAPANDYFLAEGACGYDVGFTTYILVQNPQRVPNDVTITYQTGSGEVAGPAFTMGPNSRETIRVNDTLSAGTDVSTVVHGAKPIIAERAMYWDNGTGEAFHASIGLDSPHMSFMLPDGETSNGFETWTLVSNPNPGAVTVRMTYLPQGGGKSITFTDEIPKDSRRSYSMADKLPSGRASILVESLDGARPVMVERAMYVNNRGAGTDTIGGYED
jgi:hypothetical protein